MANIIDILWRYAPIHRGVMLTIFGLFLFFFIFLIYKNGMRSIYYLILLILVWVITPLLINTLAGGVMSWSFNRLMFLFQPWFTSLLAFILFFYLLGKHWMIITTILLWMVFFAVLMAQPGAFDEQNQGVLWWMPESEIYWLSLSWLILCYTLLAYIIWYSFRHRKNRLILLSVFYFLYVAAVLFNPLAYSLWDIYRFPVGEDPLGLFNQISNRFQSGDGSWMLGVTVYYFIGNYILVAGFILIGIHLWRTGFRDLTQLDELQKARSKLKGKLLDYFDLTHRGLSNTEIAVIMSTDKATVSRQLNYIKKRLQLQEDVRTFLKRIRSS